MFPVCPESLHVPMPCRTFITVTVSVSAVWLLSMLKTASFYPGGVGYDINCGVRLLSTSIPDSEFQKARESIGHSLLSRIPTGMTKKSSIKLKRKELMKVLRKGAEEIENNYMESKNADRLRFIESGGRLEFDMPEILSERAIERGLTQVGSLGGGNHFIEVQRVG